MASSFDIKTMSIEDLAKLKPHLDAVFERYRAIESGGGFRRIFNRESKTKTACQNALTALNGLSSLAIAAALHSRSKTT